MDLHAIFGAKHKSAPKKISKKGIHFRKFTAIMKVAPTNLEEEKKRFFDSNFQYNPEFKYKLKKIKQRMKKPKDKYLSLAIKILEKSK